MRHKILLVLLCILWNFPCMLCVDALGAWAYAYDFKVANEDGNELCYNKLEDSVSVEFTYDEEGRYRSYSYKYLDCDTLRIPERVSYNGKEYSVVKLGQRAFRFMNPAVKVLSIPKTVNDVFYGKLSGSGSEARVLWSTFQCNNLLSILVDPQNDSFVSEDGILYTYDKKTLIAYPSQKETDSLYLQEGIEYLAPASFENANNLKYLELPLSLKTIGSWALVNDSIRHLIIKDNVDSIRNHALECFGLTHLTLGSKLRYVGTTFLSSDSIINIYCRAVMPPEIGNLVNSSSFLPYILKENSLLYVPRQSLSAYQQAIGWKEFGTILPIEPPIVTGVDTASVSWVQNFSATGYIWTLYTDEAKTQRFMSLTFDANGHLTHIDINNGHMPARMPALYNEDGETEKRFAEYYSFTISGLSPDTKYYYTRQSLNGTEVIDEETGAFETLSDAQEGTDNIGAERTNRKVIEDGNLYILQKEKKYSLDGNRID